MSSSTFPLAGAPPAAFIQGKASASAGSGTTDTLAYASNVKSGDMMIVGVAWTGTSAPPTISDTLVSTWAQAGQYAMTNATPNTINLALFYALAPSAGANTITVTFGSSVTGIWLVIAEFSNVLALQVIGNIGSTGGNLGYGASIYSGDGTSPIKAQAPPKNTATGALLIMLATTSGATATWSLDPGGDPSYVIAAQSGGIVMTYQISSFSQAPYGQMSPPFPSIQRTGDTSTQWLILVAPFQPNGEPAPFGVSPPGLIQLVPIDNYPLPVYQPVGQSNLQP
jgi:hypothetical protein